MKTEEKRSDDIKLITISYTRRLAATDSIQSSAWSLSSDLTQIDEGTIGTHYTYLLVQDGDEREYYTVENLITSANGEQKRTVIPIYIIPDPATIAIL